MTKEINLEWAQSLLNKDKKGSDFVSDLPQIDWVQNNKNFKRNLKFKVVPANSKENKIFSHIVATHWNLGPNKDKRFVCPEQTLHLKNLGIKCPVCEAKRRLLAKGFTEEQLSTQGKFGLIPVFDPTITSNVKVVVVDSDIKKDWDQAHISVLQQKGDFLSRWLVEKYSREDIPDFLQWNNSNLITFSRDTDNGKWEREFSFATFNPSEEVLAKLKEENEALVMPDLWKAPTDQEILEIKAIVEEMEKSYLDARNAYNDATSYTSKIDERDQIPF